MKNKHNNYEKVIDETNEWGSNYVDCDYGT
jgi:hypothetical protein